MTEDELKRAGGMPATIDAGLSLQGRRFISFSTEEFQPFNKIFRRSGNPGKLRFNQIAELFDRDQVGYTIMLRLNESGKRVKSLISNERLPDEG